VNRIFLLILLVLAPSGYSLAVGTSSPGMGPSPGSSWTPTPTPDSTKGIQATFTPTPASPTPTRTPFLAPTWAPESAGTGPSPLEPKKPSFWMTTTGIGIGIPASTHLQQAYSTGFNIAIGSGYKLTEQLSLWLDLGLNLYNSKNDSLTNGNNYTLIEGAFWIRYRFLDSGVSPYILAGPGLAYNEFRNNNVVLYDPTTGYGYIPINSSEVDFLMEGGLGIDMRLGEGIDTYLQGKLTYIFTSPNFTGYASPDNPIIVVPLELGIIFGI
jgi:Outer membrane protein beta-barrel domain